MVDSINQLTLEALEPFDAVERTGLFEARLQLSIEQLESPTYKAMATHHLKMALAEKVVDAIDDGRGYYVRSRGTQYLYSNVEGAVIVSAAVAIALQDYNDAAVGEYCLPPVDITPGKVGYMTIEGGSFELTEHGLWQRKA